MIKTRHSEEKFLKAYLMYVEKIFLSLTQDLSLFTALQMIPNAALGFKNAMKVEG